jgi:hypothetical protein
VFEEGKKKVGELHEIEKIQISMLNILNSLSLLITFG